MTNEEIAELVEAHRIYSLPDASVETQLSLALVESDDPMFLLQIPEPFRTRIIRTGLEVTDIWQNFTSNGIVDYSLHARSYNKLVTQFLNEVPIGVYRYWPKTTSQEK